MSKRFSLDHLQGFSLSGPDARSFAQSQFTVAVDALPANCWSPLAWCDPKGRVLAVMMALPGENNVDFALPAEQSEAIRGRLQMFTIGRDVRISEPYSLAGNLEPDPSLEAIANEDARVMGRDSAAPPNTASSHRWQRLDICRGLPFLTPESSGQHLPQWLGLDRLGALVFDKGCYPGQEVIARLHYRGSAKYRLAGLALSEASISARHARVTDTQDRKLGHSISALSLEDGAIALAVVAIDVEPGSMVVVHEGNRVFEARVTAPEALC